MMTHMCIDTTVPAAKGLGYEIDLIADATVTRALIFDGEVIPASSVQKSFLSAINRTFAKVIKADDFFKEN